MRVPGGKCESKSVDRNPGAPTLKGWTEEEKSFRERDMVAEMGAGEVGHGNREKRELLRHSQDRSHLQPRYATPDASESISCSSWQSQFLIECPLSSAPLPKDHESHLST